MHRTIAFFIIFLTVAAACRSASADVTVTMRGSFVTSPGFNVSQAIIDRVGRMLNSTVSYKGQSARYVFGDVVVVYRPRDKTAMAINNSTHRYAFLHNIDPSMSAIVRKSLMNDGLNTQIHTKVDSTSTIEFDGHKCRRYYVESEIYFSDYGIWFTCTYDEVFAIDFPGIDFISDTVGKTKVRGVLLREIDTMSGGDVAATERSDAVAISTTPLREEDFEIGAGYVKVASADAVGYVSDLDLAQGGLMSAKPVDPYANLNQFTGPAKAKELVEAGKFDDAAALTRDLTKRGYSKSLGPVYRALGDQATATNKVDVAWGWYSLVVENSSDPVDIVPARFALANYFIGNHNDDDARQQLQAIVDLPSASQADKDRATQQLGQLPKY